VVAVVVEDSLEVAAVVVKAVTLLVAMLVEDFTEMVAVVM
jgi:hypothetical protein